MLKRMSYCDRERMGNSESVEFPIKREMEESFPHTATKLENNDIVDSVGLFDDGSLFMDPDMEFKAEPEIFESSEDDMKYSFNSEVSISEKDLQISVREMNKEEEENVKTSVKEECGIRLGFSLKEDKENRRGRGKESLQNEEQIRNSDCEKPPCQESDSKTHTDAGTREKPFGGVNYKKQFSGVVDPNTHKLIQTVGQFRCRECGKAFCKQVDLKAHYETHCRRSTFMCSDCGKVFFRKSSLITHLRIHTGEKPFKCNVCGKEFTLKGNLTAHLRIHTGEKPFMCGICDKAFSQRNGLTTHFRIHTGKKPFKCIVCDKAFSQKSTLMKHHRIHTVEKPFKCSVCEQAFSNEMACSTHEKIHARRLFECRECGKEFTQKYNLKIHLRIHTGETYKCGVCNKAFTKRNALTTHYRIHTGEKPFKCSVCNKAFSMRYTLTRHYRIHLMERPFKCSVCNKAYSERGTLTKHYRIHTGTPFPRAIKHVPQVANGSTPTL